MVRKYTCPFFCFFLVICSCNKDSNPDYPSVQISSPYSLASFTIPGSIVVTGHVSDSKSLTSVSVYVSNSQNTPVEQSVQIPVTSNNMNVSCTYSLSDNHMVSGEYYMTITASNGTNIASAFQQIYINTSPIARTAIYAITRNNTGINVWKINSSFHDSLSYTVSGDYSSSDINSYYQQLYIAGHDSGNVNVYSVPVPAYAWNIPAIPSPSPYFTNVYCNNDVEFVSFCSNPLGYVKCYNHSGGLQAVYNSQAGYYPGKTFLWNGLVSVEEKNISLTASENLLTYYEGGGSLEQINIPGSIINMFGYDNSFIFLFGNNSSGMAYLKLYDVQNNTIYSPITIPSAQMLSAAQINAGTYLISFNNGTIYQYTYNPSIIAPFISGITASTIRYDSLNNEVIAAENKTISEYAYNTGSARFIASVSVPDSVLDLKILYNK
jgi:hypothetical protein